MTNAERFRNPDERQKAFSKFCSNGLCAECYICRKFQKNSNCKFIWLDLEYKEELKPCPFCGGEAMERKSNRVYYVFCKNCSVKTVDSITLDNAIAAWNRRV